MGKSELKRLMECQEMNRVCHFQALSSLTARRSCLDALFRQTARDLFTVLKLMKRAATK
jgi:hypothetical protein